MNEKVQQISKTVRGFVTEVGAEYQRTTWPDRRELVQSTIVVMVFIVLLSFSVLVCDKVIQFMLHVIHA
jgi:preprotein translocase SecE subunit